METFVEGSESYGFIYVALGTLIQEGPGLEQLEDKLLDALSKLPQRIIWKKQHPAHKKIPENIKIVHWAPQQDLLGKVSFLNLEYIITLRNNVCFPS